MSDKKSPHKNKSIRTEYQKLTKKVELKETTAEEVHEILEDANQLLSKVDRGQEAFLDAKFFSSSVRKIKEDADLRRGKRGLFDTEEFGDLLAAKYASEFSKVGENVQHFFKRASSLDYLLGSVERERPSKGNQSPVKKIVRPKSRVDKEIPLKPTRFVTEPNKAKSQGPSMVELVKEVEACLKASSKGKDKLGLFHFIINPTSFSETVRNLFLVSFLVKEKKAVIFVSEEDDLPYIARFSDKKRQRRNSGEDSKGQMIQSITRSQWGQLVEVLKITEPMIRLSSSSSEGT